MKSSHTQVVGRGSRLSPKTIITEGFDAVPVEDATCVGTGEPRAPVATQLVRLEGAVRNLERLTDVIETRFGFTLTPPPPNGPKPDVNKAEVVRAGITQVLANYASNVERACAHIEDIIARCELPI